jgi:predicted TIM-barrel fold metal-dependent hydrolase
VEIDLAFVSDKLDRFVLYGSDFPQYPVDTYLKAYEKLIENRPGVNRQLVFGANAVALFGLPLGV